MSDESETVPVVHVDMLLWFPVGTTYERAVESVSAALGPFEGTGVYTEITEEGRRRILAEWQEARDGQ